MEASPVSDELTEAPSGENSGGGDDPFNAQPDVILLLKLGAGDLLTTEETERWRAYEVALAEAERRRSLLGIVDLGDVVEHGTTAPEMLTPRIVRYEYQTWYGMKESVKTFVALVEAWKLMLQGHTVVWVDKEMGRRNLADRFKTLGKMSAHSKAQVAAVIREYLVYCEYPTMDRNPDSIAAWTALLSTREPVVIFIDAQTGVLADADLNENKGTDIEKWMKAYVTPARRMYVTVVMLDHTGHTEQGRPIAAQHKGAAAKVELHFKVGKKPNRETVGNVTITVNKNTADAPIPEVQLYRIGGDGEGGFVFEPMEAQVPDLDAATKGERGAYLRIRAALRQAIEKTPGMNKTNVLDGVSGGTTEKGRALASLVESGEVERREGTRANSLLYFLATPDLPTPTPDSQGVVGKSREESRKESRTVANRQEGSTKQNRKSREPSRKTVGKGVAKAAKPARRSRGSRGT